MKLDQIGHFIVCVSYKWYQCQCHSNDFNLFLRLALGYSTGLYIYGKVPGKWISQRNRGMFEVVLAGC